MRLRHYIHSFYWSANIMWNVVKYCHQHYDTSIPYLWPTLNDYAEMYHICVYCRGLEYSGVLGLHWKTRYAFVFMNDKCINIMLNNRLNYKPVGVVWPPLHSPKRSPIDRNCMVNHSELYRPFLGATEICRHFHDATVLRGEFWGFGG